MTSLVALDSRSRRTTRRPPIAEEDRIIQQALAVLERRAFAAGPPISGMQAAISYLRLKLLQEANELFAAVFLTTRHRVIALDVLFRGTIDGAEVHPRVVIQRALALNAAALIVCHQHPSGHDQPSAADRAVTAQLKSALALVDVRLLDHIIFGQGEPFSFANAGLL